MKNLIIASTVVCHLCRLLSFMVEIKCLSSNFRCNQLLFCTSEITLHLARVLQAQNGKECVHEGVRTSSVFVSRYSTDTTPVSGDVLHKKTLRSMLLVAQRWTSDAPGEFPLQACPGLAFRRRWHWFRKGTSCVSAPPRQLSAPTRGSGPGPGFYTRHRWGGCVFLPARDASEVYVPQSSL